MRIVFHSFAGRYSDNPRAIHERLAERAGLEQVWLADLLLPALGRNGRAGDLLTGAAR